MAVNIDGGVCQADIAYHVAFPSFSNLFWKLAHGSDKPFVCWAWKGAYPDGCEEL